MNESKSLTCMTSTRWPVKYIKEVSVMFATCCKRILCFVLEACMKLEQISEEDAVGVGTHPSPSIPEHEWGLASGKYALYNEIRVKLFVFLP